MAMIGGRGRSVAAAILVGLLAACQPGSGDAPPPTAAASASVSAATLPARLQESADRLLARHRQLIVLMDGEQGLEAEQRRAVQGLGQQIFHDMQRQAQELWGLIDPHAEEAATREALERLLDRIESEPGWFDADRLAFKELLRQVAAHYASAQSIAGLKLAKRANEDLAVLAEVEQAYEQELRDSFGRFAKRGIELKREKWSDYVTRLRGLYSREQILREHGLELPAARPASAAEAGTRGAKRPARELFGDELPPKTIVLTFDDGPHPRYTDEILEILKRYEAPAIFFQLGQNLGQIGADGQPKPGNGSKIAQRVLSAGHQLANHSFSHGLMSKFETVKVRAEAAQTEALLDGVGRSGQALFRFPYGARNEAALTTIEDLKLRSMMWNVDSLDWSDPVPKSIAARVLAELDKRQRGIVLFHDIHARTVQALPLVLDQLVAEGYNFATWRDGRFVVGEGTASAARKAAGEPSPGLAGMYRDSHALIIGIDQYQQWPRLQHAVRDAQGVRESLTRQFGFRPENISLLLDGEATRANILRALNDKLGDAKRVKRDDRVFVFFAGHGSTRRLPSGREVGYVIPVDAGRDNLQADAIAMPQLQEVAEALSAKHALFVIDACYSGLGLTRGGASNFMRDNARRIGRQMMTAGGADQQVADDGPGGHSVFTWTLLQALAGKADMNGDGLITATELAAYVAPAVSAIAHQTPAFGSLPGSEGGEFVFELMAQEQQALSTDSGQLDAAASALAKRIDEVRNRSLQAAVPTAAAASAVQVLVKGLDGRDVAISTTTARVDPGARVAAQRANDRGLQHYRERRYDEAEKAFVEALKLQPGFALAANNLGFIHYKRGKPAEAARWYQKAIEMDGSRALAYLNLGDALLQAGEDGKALDAYKTFVALSPRHGRAAELQVWIAEPSAAHRPKLPEP